MIRPGPLIFNPQSGTLDKDYRSTKPDVLGLCLKSIFRVDFVFPWSFILQRDRTRTSFPPILFLSINCDLPTRIYELLISHKRRRDASMRKPTLPRTTRSQ